MSRLQPQNSSKPDCASTSDITPPQWNVGTLNESLRPDKDEGSIRVSGNSHFNVAAAPHVAWTYRAESAVHTFSFRYCIGAS